MKEFEQYAGQARSCNKLFEEAITKASDEMHARLTDPRVSDFRKHEIVSEADAGVQKAAENYTNLMREVIDRFIAAYKVTPPEDGKDHSLDIQNALKVVDMLGYDLDVENLNNILAPLSGSYQSTKTVLDVILTKHWNTPVEHARFSAELIKAVEDKHDVVERCGEYNHLMNLIESARTAAYKATFPGTVVIPGEGLGTNSINSGTAGGHWNSVIIAPTVPYDFLTVCDWMEQAGAARDEVVAEFKRLYDGEVA